MRGVTLGRLWRRYLKLKNSSDRGKAAPFKGQSVVDAEKRTLNWPFFYALIENVGCWVRTVEEEIEKKGSSSESDSLKPSDDDQRDGAQVYSDDPDSDAEDDVVYTGNEEGRPMFDEDPIWDSDESASDTDSNGNDLANEAHDVVDWEDDGEIDAEQSHIENLISIAGTSKRLYDTERWLRCILWTLHMYIDGYCSDFMFQYGKPYGPSCAVLAKFIRDHNGDPFVLRAPISNVPPLLPHEAAFAMLPRHAVHLLPKPLQRLIEDPAVRKRVFLEKDAVNIPAMLHAIEQIPESEYTPYEKRRTLPGQPFLLRRPRSGDRSPKSNPFVSRPGPKFDAIPRIPVLFRKEFMVTSSPPCYPWPQGSIRNMLDLPYLKVGGTNLSRPSRQPRLEETAVSKKSTPDTVGKTPHSGKVGNSSTKQPSGSSRAHRAGRYRRGAKPKPKERADE